MRVQADPRTTQLRIPDSRVGRAPVDVRTPSQARTMAPWHGLCAAMRVRSDEAGGSARIVRRAPAGRHGGQGADPAALTASPPRPRCPTSVRHLACEVGRRAGRRGGNAKARFPPCMGVAAPVAAAYFLSGSRLGRSGILLRRVSQVTLPLRISSLSRLPCRPRAGCVTRSVPSPRSGGAPNSWAGPRPYLGIEGPPVRAPRRRRVLHDNGGRRQRSRSRG